MVETIVIVVVVAIAAVLIYAVTKAKAFRIERTISIKASPRQSFR